jgi:hypothetical protein
MNFCAPISLRAAILACQRHTKSFVNQNLNAASIRPSESSESPMLTNVSGRSIYVQYSERGISLWYYLLLVSSSPEQHTKIRHRLEQLRGQRESDIGDICNTDEPIENRVISLCSFLAVLSPSCDLIDTTYFFRMLNRVFNFEPSSPPVWPSAALGVDSVGVEVPDLSSEPALDDVVDETDMLCGRNEIPTAIC